jgi:diguanylate cyclase (GGDEF)-like protein/PAS domain S-box-containing protein
MDREVENYYQKIVSMSDDFMAYYSTDFRILAVNQAYANAHKINVEDLIGKPLEEVFKGRFLKQIQENLTTCLRGKPVYFESAYDYPGCGKRNVKISYKPEFDKDGDVIGAVVNVTDITFLKEQEAKLEKANQELRILNRKDVMTDIYNRAAYDKRIKEEIAYHRRHKSTFCLLIIDVDYFKKYNDNYGHLAGDVALKKIVSVTQKMLKRETDFFARYGGEEFVVILPSTSKFHAKKIAKSINKAISDTKIPHEYSNVSDYLTVSVGVAEYKETDDHASLFSKVDEALYHAKSKGRNQVLVYD